MGIYDARLRVFATKSGKTVDEDEVKSKKSNYGTKWSDFGTKMAKSAQNDDKPIEKRQLDKMARFAHNYGYSGTSDNISFNRAEIETVTADSDTEAGNHHKFKVNDRVILTYDYIPTEEYPVWGSRHECVGTVYGMKDGGTRVLVEWDNGTAHDYPSTRVSLYDTRLSIDNPNRAFKRRKNDRNRSK